MADEPKKAGPGTQPSPYAVPRREPRHPVPAVYQRYIHLKVKIGDNLIPVILHNFSGSGILFESRVPFEIETPVNCVVSIPLSLSIEISFDVRVKHCTGKNTTFFIGAAVENAADATWFAVFREVHDFIMQRQGEVY